MAFNNYYSSDHHFGHGKTFDTFKRADGTPLRNFSSVEEMNEYMVEKHNSVVKPGDKWFCVGDVAINKNYLHLVHRLNGHKILIPGNHDIFGYQAYLDLGFEEIWGVYVSPKRAHVSSHVPLHPASLGRWNANIHGHLHANRVQIKVPGGKVIDPRYVNVSVECLNDYTPFHADEISNLFKKQKEEFLNKYDESLIIERDH